MNGWTLLRSREDYNGYLARLAADFGLAGQRVQWGCAPSTYPCLVASKVLSPSQVASCYVLPVDAQELLAALPVASLKEEDSGLRSPPPVAMVQREEYDRSLSALILTIVHTMVETGQVRPAQFEADYARFLAMVDQEHTHRQLSSARDVLDALSKPQG